MAITLGVNAYITNQDFQDWASERGYNFYPYIANIDSAIVVASVDYIDTTYSFKGSKVDASQKMKLPTDEVAIADIRNAAGQAVWQQLQGLLFVAQSADGAKGQITSEMSKLGDLEESFDYAEGSQRTFTHSTRLIDNFIAPYTAQGAGSFGGIYRV